MTPTLATKLLVVGGVVVVTVGAVATAIDADWDVFAVFLLAAVLALTLLARLESRRPAIPVRRDLVAWLSDRAVLSGESLGAVTDRALSAYRQQYGDAAVSATTVPPTPTTSPPAGAAGRNAAPTTAVSTAATTARAGTDGRGDE